jgi:hypothetical protein
MKKTLVMTFVAAAGFLAAGAYAQPALNEANTGPELLCSVDTAASNAALTATDTVASIPDSNGFRAVFNGKDFTGWWQNCRSTHTSNKTWGGIFRVDSVRKAIYVMQRNGTFGGTSISQNGGLLSTRKRYDHYDISFDWWPDYGNDGGIFNRMRVTSNAVSSNQMVLDYMGASGVLSYYSEAGFPGSRNGRPWTYTGSTPTTAGQVATGDTNIAIPGEGGNSADLSNWTNTTQKIGAAQFGCATGGCVKADYKRLWRRYGWVQVRQRYYGGMSTTQGVTAFTLAANLTANTNDKTRAQTFFRTFYPVDTSVQTWNATTMSHGVQNVSDTAQWIPVVKDSFAMSASDVGTHQKKSFIGFQIHNGSRYRTVAQGGKGTWYRNIRIRELDAQGIPVAILSATNRRVRYDVRVSSGMLTGSIDLDHVILVNDVNGKVLARIAGDAGSGLRYALPSHSGMMVVRVKTMRGQQVLRIAQGATR